MTNKQVIDELIELTDKHLEQIQNIQNLPQEVLFHNPTNEQWNIVQCATHLNHYFDFYLPQFDTPPQLTNIKSNDEFKPGFIGGYFASMLLYKDNMKKIKSPDHTNPIHTIVPIESLDTLKDNLQRLKSILANLSSDGLATKNIKTMFSSWYKLKLGDGLRIVIYHNDRHFHQMNNLIP